MGVDVVALIAEWEPLVDATRQSGGLDFYWDAAVKRSDALGDTDWRDRPDALPYATEIDDSDVLVSGRYLWLAFFYYQEFEEALPEDLWIPVNAFHSMVVSDGDTPDDLAADAGLDSTPERMYTMRPATVKTALARADQVPWDELEKHGERFKTVEVRHYSYDYDQFHWLVEIHLGWLREAAAGDRGLVVLASY